MADDTNTLMLQKLDDIATLLRQRNTAFEIPPTNLLLAPTAISLGASERQDFFDSFRSIQITGLTGAVSMALNNQNPQPVFQGFYWETPDVTQFVKQLTFVETAGASASVTFQLGYGKMDDRRVNLSSGGLVLSASSGFNTPARSTVGTSSASVLAASTIRTSAMFQNNGTTNIWLGDSTVSTIRGIKLAPNASLIATHKAEIFAISDAAGGLLNVWEETN